MPWSKWLEPGFYISYYALDESTIIYQRIKRRDFAHQEWEFGSPDVAVANRVLDPLSYQGPYMPGGLNNPILASTTPNMLHQIIYGIKPFCYSYVEWPSETKRHGTPRRVWWSTNFREVAHYTMKMSPFDKPSFITQLFLLEDILESLDFGCYNPSDKYPVLPRYNFLIAKMQLEKIGEVDAAGNQAPAKGRWKETLDRLYRGLLYSRPITFVFPRTLSG